MQNKKIFVIGNSRSGTTMMGRILGNHSLINTFPELHFFEQLWSPSEGGISISIDNAKILFAKLLCIGRDGYLTGCSQYTRYIPEADEQIKSNMNKLEVFSKYLEYESSLKDKTISCDQTPRNLFYVEEILNYYSDAKIIYMIRDPRDVLLSQKNKWKRRSLGAKSIPLIEAIRSWINYHPITICQLWNATVNSMHSIEDHSSIKTIIFENLLEEPHKHIEEICDFLEIDYQEEMLNIPQVGSSVGHDDPSKKGINKTRTSAYKNGTLSNTELYICESILKNNMNKLNYLPDGYKPNILMLVGLYVTFPIKIFLALLFNLKRMKNIKESIKRRMR